MRARLSPLIIRLLLLAWGLGGLVGCAPEAITPNPCSGVFCTHGHCKVQDGKPVCERDFPGSVSLIGPLANDERTLPEDPDNARRAKGYFSVNAEHAHVYRFSCSSQTGDCSVRLLDGGGNAIRSATHTIEFGSVQGGRFFLEVSVPKLQTVEVGGIQWSFQDFGQDDHFDSEATPFDPAAGPRSGEFERPQDTELFKVALRGGRAYRSTCSYCKVTVSTASGTVVASHQSLPGYVRVPADGEYLLALVNANQQGPWNYRLEEIVDEHGDSAPAATWLTLPVPPLAGVIEPPDDVDAVAFSATNVGHIYRFTCEAPVGQEPWAIQLVHGTQPMGGTPSYKGSSATLAVELSTPGTYTASVSRGGTNAVRTGGYTCRVEDAGLDDHGDDAAHASPLTLGSVTTGVLETWEDQDVFSVPLTAGRTYTLLVSDSAVEVLVSSPDGSALWRGGTHSFTPATSGLHTLQASVTSDVVFHRFGPYQLQLQAK